MQNKSVKQRDMIKQASRIWKKKGNGVMGNKKKNAQSLFLERDFGCGSYMNNNYTLPELMFRGVQTARLHILFLLNVLNVFSQLASLVQLQPKKII